MVERTVRGRNTKCTAMDEYKEREHCLIVFLWESIVSLDWTPVWESVEEGMFRSESLWRWIVPVGEGEAARVRKRSEGNKQKLYRIGNLIRLNNRPELEDKPTFIMKTKNTSPTTWAEKAYVPSLLLAKLYRRIFISTM